MPDTLVRDWKEDTLARVRLRAKSNRRSVSAEVQVLVEKALDAEALAQRVKKYSLAQLIRGEPLTNRTQAEIDADVRALRDEWED